MARYGYECAKGHGLWSPKVEPKCRAYVHGERCKAPLRQTSGPKPKK
jgi:hypothetical protein